MTGESLQTVSDGKHLHVLNVYTLHASVHYLHRLKSTLANVCRNILLHVTDESTWCLHWKEKRHAPSLFNTELVLEVLLLGDNCLYFHVQGLFLVV